MIDLEKIAHDALRERVEGRAKVGTRTLARLPEDVAAIVLTDAKPIVATALDDIPNGTDEEQAFAVRARVLELVRQIARRAKREGGAVEGTEVGAYSGGQIVGRARKRRQKAPAGHVLVNDGKGGGAYVTKGVHTPTQAATMTDDEIEAGRELYRFLSSVESIRVASLAAGAPGAPLIEAGQRAKLRALYLALTGYSVEHRPWVRAGRDAVRVIELAKSRRISIREAFQRASSIDPLPGLLTENEDEIGELADGCVIGRGGGRGAGRSIPAVVAEWIEAKRAEAARKRKLRPIPDLVRLLTP